MSGQYLILSSCVGSDSDQILCHHRDFVCVEVRRIVQSCASNDSHVHWMNGMGATTLCRLCRLCRVVDNKSLALHNNVRWCSVLVHHSHSFELPFFPFCSSNEICKWRMWEYRIDWIGVVCLVVYRPRPTTIADEYKMVCEQFSLGKNVATTCGVNVNALFGRREFLLQLVASKSIGNLYYYAIIDVECDDSRIHHRITDHHWLWPTDYPCYVIDGNPSFSVFS